MPSGISEYGTGYWLSALFGVVPLPDGYWIAACIDEPGEVADGTTLVELEPPDPAYARRWYPSDSSHWDEDGGWLTSVVDLSFPRATVDWGALITHYALLDADTGGNLFAWGEIDDAPDIATGQRLTLPAGGLVIGLASIADSIAV